MLYSAVLKRVFVLDANATEAFDRIMSEPPQPNAALIALMKRKAPWE